MIEAVSSTRFFDWVDHLTLPQEMLDGDELAKHGFVEIDKGRDVFHAPGTDLFPLRFHDGKTELALKVDDVDVFRSVWSVPREAEGERFAPFRRLSVLEMKSGRLIAVERRGYDGFDMGHSDDASEYESALGLLRRRVRDRKPDEDGIHAIEGLIAELRSGLDPPRLADAFARSEIEYWSSRNSAARVQQMVQDELGLGWANQDHLTFRCSRLHFHRLINLLEVMGFQPREKFYAGDVAGWGAQVMEHPIASRIVFADVDLLPKENSGDFAHRPLPETEQLGTVGLWVALHGESLLQAGMHHMAVRVDFDRARESLSESGVRSMTPFSDFPFLRQLFTVGEEWSVDGLRATQIRDSGRVEKDWIDMMEKKGALGSHMELTQRASGFKGFNQSSVSAIIKATNPLTYKGTQA